MSKINVYSSSASNAIKVFDASSTGLKPDNAILVTTGTEPSNAIQINIGDKKWSSIAVNFGGEEPEPPTPTGSNNRITYLTNTYENTSFSTQGNRTVFMVLPSGTDTSQFGNSTDGLNVLGKSNVFWITDYNITNEGDLQISGYRGQNNNEIEQHISNWPELNTNKLHCDTNYTLGNTTSEFHKRSIPTPSDAIAALVTYDYYGNIDMNCIVVSTDKTYNDITDCTCGIILNGDLINHINNMEPNDTYTTQIRNDIITYPLQTNKTIVCGSMNYFGH